MCEDMSNNMLYFKNVDLADTYHVSLRTVLNWIEAAKQGKLDLTLHTKNEKSYVANTARNIATIEKIVAERKKYRNTRGHKVVSPKDEFYKLYDVQQIIDIISNLEVHHELPLQYSYFDGGSDYWDKYTQRLLEEEAPNVLKSTQRLLGLNGEYIDALLEGYKYVNVIDIGVGNALPVKEFLENLLQRKLLKKYIALDISPDMLKIAKRNIEQWFNGEIPFESYNFDVNYDRFNQLLTRESFDTDTINVVLLFGGTIHNLRNPDAVLRVIRDSMGRNDLLFFTKKLDTETSRRYFDFNTDPNKSTLATNHRLLLELLNLDEEIYDIETGYDEVERQRYIRVRLKVAVTVEFDVDGKQKEVMFNKDDAILVWRSWQMTSMDVIEQFDRTGFYMLQSSQIENQEYIFAVLRIKGDTK